MKSKNLTIWVIVVALCLTSPQVMGWTEFKDGATHNINYEIADEVWVDYKAPRMQTTLNWLDGASTPRGYDLQAFEDSRINIFGGSIGGMLWALGSSRVAMSGGTIGHNFVAGDSSQVIISGGWLNQSLSADDSSQVTISGGLIDGGLRTSDSGQLTLSGGWIGNELTAAEHSILTIHGVDFAVDGKYFGYGELSSILGGFLSDEPRRRLTGTLASGNILNKDFRIGGDARIVLVPEPATLLLLTLGGLMLLCRPSKYRHAG